MSEFTFFSVFALFIVWMQRHHRWVLLANAAEGNVQLKSRM